MRYLVTVGLVIWLSACGSSTGTGLTGSTSGGLTAPFVSTAVQSDNGAWAVISQSATDGNDTVTIQQLVALFSSIDLCATFTNDPNSTADPEVLSIGLLAKTLAVPANGNYVVASDTNAISSTSFTDTLAGVAQLAYVPANATAESNTYVGTAGAVLLTAAPTSSTTGSLSGSVAASFEAYEEETETDAQVLDDTGTVSGTAAGSMSGAFSAAYCPALATQLAAAVAESGSASTSVQRLPRALSPLQRRMVDALPGFRAAHR